MPAGSQNFLSRLARTLITPEIRVCCLFVLFPVGLVAASIAHAIMPDRFDLISVVCYVAAFTPWLLTVVSSISWGGGKVTIADVVNSFAGTAIASPETPAHATTSRASEGAESKRPIEPQAAKLPESAPSSKPNPPSGESNSPKEWKKSPFLTYLFHPSAFGQAPPDWFSLKSPSSRWLRGLTGGAWPPAYQSNPIAEALLQHLQDAINRLAQMRLNKTDLKNPLPALVLAKVISEQESLQIMSVLELMNRILVDGATSQGAYATYAACLQLILTLEHRADSKD